MTAGLGLLKYNIVFRYETALKTQVL